MVYGLLATKPGYQDTIYSKMQSSKVINKIPVDYIHWKISQDSIVSIAIVIRCKSIQP